MRFAALQLEKPLQHSDLEATTQENPKSHEMQKSKHRVIFYALTKISAKKDRTHGLIKGALPYEHMLIFKSKQLTPHTSAPLMGV